MSSGREKAPGHLVKHDDGRRGIAYHADQTPEFQDQGKVVVQFTDDDWKPEGKLKAVKADKLKQIGFVD